MTKYKALSTIDYNGKKYLVGEEIPLDADAAKELLAMGRVEEVGSGAHSAAKAARYDDEG